MEPEQKCDKWEKEKKKKNEMADGKKTVIYRSSMNHGQLVPWINTVLWLNGLKSREPAIL